MIKDRYVSEIDDENAKITQRIINAKGMYSVKKLVCKSLVC